MTTRKNTIGHKNPQSLITPELEARFKEVGCQKHIKDPLVIARFFNPCGSGTWYATGYYPDEKIFFGYASIFRDHNDEWGYFSLQELENTKLRFGLSIERDLYFQEKPISECLKKDGLTPNF